MSELTNEDIKQRVDNYNKTSDQLERTGGRLDVSAIYEGAKRAEEERAERQRKLREQQAAAQAAKDKELNDLLAKAGEKVKRDKEAKAQAEIKEAKAKADMELAAQIRNQNGLKSEEEEALDNSYRSMLGNFNL